MPGKAPSLAELQAQFQAAVLSGEDGVLTLIPPNSRTGSEVLLGVYRYAYAARLVEILKSAHPALALHMGCEAFDAMARSYVARFPSRHANARWLASDLPEFLGAAPYSASPELREIALIERQLDLAFDAEDAPVLDLAGLAVHAPDTWPQLVFLPHPSACPLKLSTNAFELWCALKEGEAAPTPQILPEAEYFLVWRQEATPRIRRLGAEEQMLWREAAKGVSFAALAEMAAFFGDAETAALRVAQYLQGWLGSGLLRGVMTASEAASV